MSGDAVPLTAFRQNLSLSKRAEECAIRLRVPKSKPFRHLAHPSALRDHPIVFLTCAIHQRRALLANDFAHQLLRGLWERSGTMNGWYVGDYLLMPDHIHQFVRPASDADDMWRWVKMWKSVSSRELKREFGAEPPVWQEDYFDRFCDRTSPTRRSGHT